MSSPKFWTILTVDLSTFSNFFCPLHVLEKKFLLRHMNQLPALAQPQVIEWGKPHATSSESITKQLLVCGYPHSMTQDRASSWFMCKFQGVKMKVSYYVPTLLYNFGVLTHYHRWCLFLKQRLNRHYCFYFCLLQFECSCHQSMFLLWHPLVSLYTSNFQSRGSLIEGL